MQLLTLEKAQTTRLLWLVVGVLLVGVVTTAKQSDPILVATAFALGVTALLPLYFWLLGWSQGLPIWPVFAIVSGMSSALPIIQDPVNLQQYTGEEIMIGGLTTMGFIALGTLTWLGATSRPRKMPAQLLMIEQAHSVRYLLMFVGVGLLFYLNQFTGWVRFPGNTMPVVRGVSGSLSTMGLFVLGYYHGRGFLNRSSKILFIGGAALTALASMTSLMLASAMIPVAMAFFGYMMGGNRIPVRLAVLAFLLVAFLHAGKYEMRERYWSGEARVDVSPLALPGFYAEWLACGMSELGGMGNVLTGSKEEDAKSNVFARAGMIHMLLMVQKRTPSEVPYFGGLTYAHIPALLVPRFLNPEKGISHTGNIMLSINYGLASAESTVSIAWGLLAESYANFGYLGVVALAVALGLFYAWVARLTVGVPMTSLRFVVGLLVMAAATSSDTMGIFVSMQFQGIVGVTLASMLLMRWQSNPFAAEGGETERAVWSMERGAGKWGPAYARGGYGGTSGMPAPGILTNLIEGAPVERAQHGARSEELGAGHAVTAPRDVGTGGTVRTLPIRTPKRIASWMPRRVRAAVVAQYAAEEEPEGTETPKDGSEKPRQLAVPYQNYRRYRG
jgi:hypothetical protein